MAPLLGQQGGALASVVAQTIESGSDRRCVKVGCFSIVSKLLAKRVCRGPIVLGLMCAGLLLLAIPAQAQTSRFGPRAGSNFSNAPSHYGRITRRPNRRRQKPATESNSKFDYRLETAESADDSAVALYEDYEQDGEDLTGFGLAGYCACGNDTCCGDCIEPGCGSDDYCEPSCGLGDGCCNSYSSCGLGGGPTWHIGFEWSFVKPRFSENVAFITSDGNGNNNVTFTETEFDYDLELTPRVWIEAAVSDSWSWRVSYWEFDHSPSIETTQPGNDAFDEITHPPFGDVDISTTLPEDIFTATSALNAYTIDVEALKRAHLSCWQLGVGCGVRYASIEQSYFAQLRDTTNGNALRGQIDFSHALEGFGPTISLSGKRPIFCNVNLACTARGSLLFGDGFSRLDALEDTTPSTTIRLTNRDDLLPIGEARVGLEWLSPKKHSRSWQWMLSTAMEGQIWGNAGNASSETADLGFFGFNIGAGWLR